MNTVIGKTEAGKSVRVGDDAVHLDDPALKSVDFLRVTRALSTAVKELNPDFGRLRGYLIPELEAGDLAQPRVDLPVPVVGLLDALAQRRAVQDQVVCGPAQAGQKAEDRLERLGGTDQLRV